MTPNKDYFRNMQNRLVDFGPPLPYTEICPAFTVPKLSYWEHVEDERLDIVVLQTKGLPHARVEGRLYNLSDAEMSVLDKKRQNGVEFDRKRLPVVVPYLDEFGERIQVHAWIYIARREIWQAKVEYGSGRIPKERTYRQPRPISDADRYLHNRLAFFPPPNTYGRIGEPSEAVIHHVRDRNQTFGKLLSVESIGPPQQKQGWLKKFLNDD